MKLGPEPRNVSRDFETWSLGATRRERPGFWLRVGARAGALGALVLLSACGYRPAYGGMDRTRYEVTAGRYATSSFEAVQAAVAGARSELGAAGALGSGFPRVVVEILRVDERSTGVRFTPNDGQPLARGSEIVVMGRALVLEAEGAEPRIDTGDMSRTARYAAGATPTGDAAARSRAVRDAARSLGRALGRAVLGLPEPAEG